MLHKSLEKWKFCSSNSFATWQACHNVAHAAANISFVGIVTIPMASSSWNSSAVALAKAQNIVCLGEKIMEIEEFIYC